MARRLRKRYDTSPAEALWRGACGSAMARRLSEPYCGTPAEALWRDGWGALWRNA